MGNKPDKCFGVGNGVYRIGEQMNKELMAEYGELCIKAELINSQVQDCKKRINEELFREQQIKNKPEEVKPSQA